MRISDISQWVTCETMALHDSKRAGRVGVAAWVGTQAHAMLAGITVQEPDRITLDSTTPTAYAANTQARAIADAARLTLRSHGWIIIEQEQEVYHGKDTGHLDLLCWHKGRKQRAIIDLKTGQRVDTGWLQVGGYIALWEDQYSPLAMPPFETDGGILHVPRLRFHVQTKGSLKIRSGKVLKELWVARRERIQQVMDGAPPMPSPGYHCFRCAVSDCMARASVQGV